MRNIFREEVISGQQKPSGVPLLNSTDARFELGDAVDVVGGPIACCGFIDRSIAITVLIQRLPEFRLNHHPKFSRFEHFDMSTVPEDVHCKFSHIGKRNL